jgi:hypothetical protein
MKAAANGKKKKKSSHGINYQFNPFWKKKPRGKQVPHNKTEFEINST